VTCLAAKLGASATQRLRTPFASNTHATLLLREAATRFEGNGELITCSRVKPAARVLTEKRNGIKNMKTARNVYRGKMRDEWKVIS